jgi:hypothetical protein
VRHIASVLVLAAVVGVAPSYAHAESVSEGSEEGWSPEGFLLSFGVGAYRPDPGIQAFNETYPSGSGPILLGEFDFFLYRIPFLGPIGIGVAGGWANYKGNACVVVNGACDPTQPTTDRAKFTLFPLNAMAVLRIDALARKTAVPFVFTGKVGYNSVFFKEEVGTGKSSGRSHGFGWGVQVALELNFINERRANALDEDWGINSSFFFFELAGSNANSRAPVGDKFYFTGGVGLTF